MEFFYGIEHFNHITKQLMLRFFKDWRTLLNIVTLFAFFELDEFKIVSF
jgi:hypothetical protein